MTTTLLAAAFTVSGFLFLGGVAHAVVLVEPPAPVIWTVDLSGDNTCTREVPTCTTIQGAVDAALDGDTIDVAGGTYDLSAQLSIGKAISIVGHDAVTLRAISDFGTTNGSKHLLTIYAGTLNAPVTISNIALDANSNSYGVNTYNNAYGILNDVTILNSKGAGLTINGSTIVANNLSTDSNAWGAVNVDPGSGVTTASVFTLDNGQLGESPQIWSDGAHVSGDATVTVTAAGFQMYKVGGTDATFVWTDQELTNAATIAKDSVTTRYSTIQAAVDAASSGDTINVAPGEYDESISIGTPLTLIGDEGETKPIIRGSAANYIVQVHDTTGVVINGFEISGNGSTADENGFNYGVLVTNAGNSSAPIEIKNSLVQNIWKDGETSGIGVEGSSYALVHDDTISSFQKNGIRFVGSEGKVYNSQVTGDSVDGTSRVQNLVNLRGGSDVEIYGNALTNAITDTGVIPTWDSTCVFVNAYPNSVDSHASIHDNQISFCDTGIVITSAYADTDNSSASILNNQFHNLNWAINFEKNTGSATVTGNKFGQILMAISAEADVPLENPPAVDAARNWWSTANESEISALVYGAVNYTPWYADEAMTKLGLPTTSGEGDTIESTLVEEQTATTETSAGTVDIEIPSGTVITGPAGWDGTISLPTVTTTFVAPTPDSGTTATAISSIEVGLGETPLTLSNAVKLTFEGQAGKLVGWSRGGVFTEVTAVCDDALPPTLDPGADCKIDSGSDLIVWTKHFTVFTTYTQAAIPPVAVSGGGGGGGGYTGIPWDWNPYLTTANVTPATQPIATQVLGGQGEVLGVMIFNFGNDLQFGTRGDAITELQTRLTAEGVYSGPITGYFGQLTSAGVKSYQARFGIPQTGFVGPLTRAQLNGSQVAGASTVNTAAIRAQLASLQTQLVVLLQQLAQMLQSQAK